MKNPARRSASARVVVTVVVVIVAALAAYFFGPLRPGRGDAMRLLRPEPLGYAPYQYLAYDGSLDRTRQETGVDQFFAAFVVSDGTCTPVWGGSTSNGLDGSRSAQLAADFGRVRAAGGEVAVSFGGQQGLELATVCADPGQLTAAYQSVLRRYGVRRVDFDIEGATLADGAANARRAEAMVNLQRAQPDLRVWVTLPVDTAGLTPGAYALLEQLRHREVVLSGINLMTMNYSAGGAGLGALVLSSAEGAFGQVERLYDGAGDATVWRTLALTVMIGRNDTVPDTFTLQDAREVRRFASARGVGTVSMWSVDRDAPCPPGTDTTVARPTCSGVEQRPFDFLRALTSS